MYSEEQYWRALQVYDETGSVTKTITILGYPARRQTLYNWINRRNHIPKDKSTFRGLNTAPDSTLVNNMLDDAIATLRPNEHPIVHTDRGCHYRWNGWISRMESSSLIRSMSKKACSPDNSACEGFFGRVKNEFFYVRSWQDISTETFIEMLNEYLIWYRDVRIKMSLGAICPMQYRMKLGWDQS